MKFSGTFVFLLYFATLNSAQEVVNGRNEELAKRFSMNYLDTMEKRFSMNFLDTIDAPAKKIYLDLLEHPLSKRFSMNFLDTLDKPKRKRFTMNFMDTLGAEQRGYLAKHQSSHHRREENGDVSNKRSDDRIAKDKAKSIVENIDMMINYMLERYGLRLICQNKEWRDLLNVRSLLSGMVARSGKSPTVACIDPKGIRQQRNRYLMP